MVGDKEEIRERIIEAAMEVFALSGYFRAPISMVAREAGVSKGLIFWYFRSKDELILEVARRSLPIDVLEKCLSKGLSGMNALKCVGEGYLVKYKDPIMRNLMLHTMSVRTIFPQIEDKLREMCMDYTRKLAKSVFGDDSVRSRVRIRTFFGSLLCYTLRPPKDIREEEYLNELIPLIIDEG